MNAQAFQSAQNDSNRKALRWLVLIGLGGMLVLGLVLLLLLMQVADQWDQYAQYFPLLFLLNLGVASILIAVLAWLGFRMFQRLRQGKFGSRLLLKLAAIFAMVGFLPGVLIYGVSYQFVSRSIEAWFDARVEIALEAGLNLGRATLDNLTIDLSAKAKSIGLQMSELSDTSAVLYLDRIHEQFNADDVLLWSLSGTPIASVGASRFNINPERPSSNLVKQLRSAQVVTQIEGLEDALVGADSSIEPLVKVFVWLANPNLATLHDPRILQINVKIPSTLVSNAVAVQTANREYKERALAREGLRRMYIGTLTLSLFLSVFAAVLLAVVLGNQLARPLLVLVTGVRDVAAGDLGPKPVLHGKDELDGLTRSFAQMTYQLADARNTVERSMEQANLARANLQTILDNLTAGVLVLDQHNSIISSNPGATRILRTPLAAHQGKPLGSIDNMRLFGQLVAQQFETFEAEQQSHGLDHWQQSFEFSPNPSVADAGFLHQQSGTTLIVRGAILPNQEKLLVFDDISEIVSAQRAQAWGEVARRLAHEIKNPLTPIQLSAERLAMKLEGKLDSTEQAILDKSVKTIVDQVDAMKRLVNEFRDYARLPQAQLVSLDLNNLLQEILQLYPYENTGITIRTEFDLACPFIFGDAQQLRQVVHNLLQNALDASENSIDPIVSIGTRYNPTSNRVRLTIKDTGPGFTQDILKRAFEPYVTTKPRGTGLGLAVVKKIADEHGARIDLKNIEIDGQIKGAQVSLSFRTMGTET
jgi:nitrogen fixation/metabolism regulation signal transduction histidine kinase